MSLVPSLLQAIVRVDGEALVMHAGDKPYVVSPTGQVELASRGLTLDAVNGIVGQLLPRELQNALDEFGAVQYELPPIAEFPGEHFTVVVARGGDDVWTEIRRRRVPEDDRIPEELFGPSASAPSAAQSASGVSLAAADAVASHATGLHEGPEEELLIHETGSAVEARGAAVHDEDLSLPDAMHLWPDRALVDQAGHVERVAHREALNVVHREPVPVVHAESIHVAHAEPIHVAHAEPIHVARAEPLLVEHGEPIDIDLDLELAAEAPARQPAPSAVRQPAPPPVRKAAPPAVRQPVAPPPVRQPAPPPVWQSALPPPAGPEALPEPVAVVRPPEPPPAPPPPAPLPPAQPRLAAPQPVWQPAPPPALAEVSSQPVADVRPLPTALPPAQPRLAPPPQPAVVLPISRNPIRSEQPPPAMADPTLSGLDRLLRLSAARGASTLYLSSDSRPSVRVDGELQMLEGEPVLSVRDVESLLLTLMPERSHEALRTGAATEWICDIEDVGRVRCMSVRDHRGPGGVFRLMPTRSVSVDQLGLPRQVQSLAIEPEGLVLVAGPRSSGKRTLMAAFVDLMNRTRRDHVITIEREINIVHERGNSFISQREVRGNDDDMLTAARAALREDPDVLVIEDLRTGGLMNVALDAAASGRLVVGGFSAHTATGAIDRIIDLYAPEHRRQVQLSLADSLRGVIVQVLLRKIGGGRLPAREILLNTPAVSSVIAEGKTSQLPMAIEGGRRYGMMPLNDTLAGLVQSGAVEGREAYRRSPDRPGLLAALARQGIDTSFVERLA